MKRSWIGYLLIIACVCFCMASCDEKETSSNVDTSQSISSEDNILSESEAVSKNVSSGTDVSGGNVSSGDSGAASGEDVSSSESGEDVSPDESGAVSSEDVSSSDSEDISEDESSDGEADENSFNTSEAESIADNSDELIESTEESSTMESKEESSEDASEVSKIEESSEDISKDTSKDTSKDSSKDTSKDSSKDTSKDSSKDTSKDNSKDISKDMSKENSKESSEASSEEPSSEESYVEESSAVHTHSYTSVVYEPWCGIEGYTEHTCECGDVYTDNYVAALEHTYGDWKVIEEPSTIADGKKRRVCKVCTKFQYEAIPKIVVTITQEDLDMMAEEALDELNKFRIENGRQPLVTGPIAHQIANERAEELTLDFSHNGGSIIFEEYKYNPESEWGLPQKSTECIANMGGGCSTGIYKDKENDLKGEARAALRGFQTSSGHWARLMREEYTACGIGFYVVLNNPDAPTEYDIYICVIMMDKLYGADAE